MALSQTEPYALLQQAEAQVSQGSFSSAQSILSTLLEQGMNTQKVYELLGIISLKTGRHEDALARFQQAAMADMKVGSSHYYLGLTLEKMGHVNEAIQSYTRAAKLSPDEPTPLARCAELLLLANQREQALPYSVRLCQVSPLDKRAWDLYVRLTHNMQQFYEVERNLLEPLAKAKEVGMYNQLRACAVRQIQFSDWMLELVRLIDKQSFPDLMHALSEKLSSTDFLKRLQQPLLLDLMHRDFITHRFTEWVLTQARRQLLLKPELHEDESFTPLLLALWALGFNNEYAFYITEEENTALAPIRNSLTEAIEQGRPINITHLALLGSYTPLIKENFAEKLNEWTPQDPQVVSLLQQQIGQPLNERQRMQSIPMLVEITDETTQKVRQQYENAPYPRWSELPAYEPISLNTYIERFGLTKDQYAPLPENAKEVLIAGCGTGQHPIALASSLTECNLLAVDISLASLAYAQRKAEELNTQNLSFMQADILTLEKLDRQFDMIESIGVLHHMQDPMAGWEVLTKILKPGGTMRIGLYSKIARESITLAREEIQKRNLGDSDEVIRQYRQELMEREYQHRLDGSGTNDSLIPILPKLFAANDFYALSECRDLIFHVQEHQFTLPQIKEAVTELGLNFLGMNLMNVTELEAFQKTLPQDTPLDQLDHWHEYEMKHPDSFNGMYQFWLQKPAD